MILIVARSNNFNHLNQVIKINSKDHAKNLYGFYSPLSNALSRLFDLGIESCYACNVQVDTDYFEIINQIDGLPVDYILLPELTFDKKMKMKNGTELPIYVIMSNILTESKFIVTDRHIKDFVSMSHFISHYNTVRFELSKIVKFKSNISLVANHLKDSDYANIDVACSLLKSEIGDYPRLDCGKSDFQFEREDFSLPIIFFKNNLCSNYFNLGEGVESNLVIERLLNAIKKELDNALNYLVGKRYNKNTLFTVYNHVSRILDLRKTKYFEDYKILDIYIQNGTLHVETEILPYFSFDYIKIHNVIRGV